MLQSDTAKASDAVKVLHKDSVQMSIMNISRLFYAPKEHARLADKFFSLTAIAPKYKDDMRRRINGEYDLSYMKIS